MKIKIAQFGLGPIGMETLKLAVRKPWAEIVGAVDNDARKAGRDLGRLCGERRLRGRKVFSSANQLLEQVRPDLTFHTTVSAAAAAFEQLKPLIRQGMSVVSSCEELIYPWLKEPKKTGEFDRLCRRSGARVVAAGVNPGFVMDVLPLVLTGVCRDIRSISVRRVVNASTRREPLQRKIGSGAEPAEFQRRLDCGLAGHAGLGESLALLAHMLGWEVRSLKEVAEVIVARRRIRTAFFDVPRGMACGIHQRVEATCGRCRLALDLTMRLDAPDAHDRIEIDGDPPLKVQVENGVAGDAATVAALVNVGPILAQAPPGFHLLPDLACPRIS